MTNEQVNELLLSAFGLLLVLVNKPFGEICRACDKMIFGRDLGSDSFRFPILVIGVVMQLIGLVLLVI